MSAKTSLSKDYSAYFLLDEGKLRKLVDVLTEYSKKKDYGCEFNFVVEKADNSEYNTDSIVIVLNDDNIKRKEIHKLKISLHKEGDNYEYSRKMDCTIIFDRTREPGSHSSPVKYSIKDEDERWAFALSEDLDGYIQRTLVSTSKRFNWLLSFFDETLLPVVGFLLCVFAINLIYPLNQRRLGDLNLIEVGILIAVSIILVLLNFDKLSYRLKPIERLSNFTKINSVFYWGDQREAYDAQRGLRQNIKWIVIIGFLVSVVAGILVAFLLKR